MQIVQKFRDVLPTLVVEEFDNIVATIKAFWSVEHNADGTHGNITAKSLTVGGVPISGSGATLPTNTKGDLIAHDGVTNVRVPVGATGQVLTAAPGAAPGLNWQTPAPPGTGNVVGPASSTVNALAVYNDATGKLLRNSLITESDVSGGILFAGLRTVIQTTAGLYSAFTNNLYYDGANWMRLDTSQPGSLWNMTAGMVQHYTCPAGANPATSAMTLVFQSSAAGVLTASALATSGVRPVVSITDPAGGATKYRLQTSTQPLAAAFSANALWDGTNFVADDITVWSTYLQQYVGNGYLTYWIAAPGANPKTHTRVLLLQSDGTLNVSGPILERTRTVPMGDWTTAPYSAANFGAATGTWTVPSGNVANYAYMRIGHSVFINVVLGSTTVSAATPSLAMNLPGFLPVVRQANGTYLINQAGIGWVEAIYAISPGSYTVALYPNIAGTGTIPAGPVTLAFSIYYETSAP